MKKQPDCYIIYNVESRKSKVIPAKNKRSLIRAILRQLEPLDTNIHIYSAYMEDFQ